MVVSINKEHKYRSEMIVRLWGPPQKGPSKPIKKELYPKPYFEANASEARAFGQGERDGAAGGSFMGFCAYRVKGLGFLSLGCRV